MADQITLIRDIRERELLERIEFEVNANKECNARIKELEQERDDNFQVILNTVDTCKKIRAERDRLREALQTIADECEIEFQYAADVANAALKDQA